jgi:hypothetical protein
MSRILTKPEREIVRLKFNGKCAYCGEDLPKRWHADHLLPVQRLSQFVPGKGLVTTKELEHPERDSLDNMMPACPPCNIDKHVMKLEDWRLKLQRACEVLRRNNPTYRHAVRFGLIAETVTIVKFHFEQVTSTV